MLRQECYHSFASWSCREEELAAVARIQAEAFYEASPIAPLDSLLYYIFQVLRPPVLVPLQPTLAQPLSDVLPEGSPLASEASHFRLLYSRPSS